MMTMVTIVVNLRATMVAGDLHANDVVTRAVQAARACVTLDTLSALTISSS
jgi:hypothetical protein